jgi:hypothetical protein
MQRDLDFLRLMMLKIEEKPYKEVVDRSFFLQLDPSPEKIAYHAELLIDSKYIIGNIYRTIGFIPDFEIYRLTSDGCDYLDSIRNDNVWNTTKDKLLSVGSSASLAVVKAIAEGSTLALIKAHSPIQ